MKALFRFGLVLLLLAVVGMTSAIVTMHYAIHGAEVTVPDLHGMTVAEAGRRTADLGLNLHVEARRYSADVAAGRVAQQSPAAGMVVRRGWRVWLTESLGAQKQAIPNVTGASERLAAMEIRRAGLELGTVAEMPWAAAPAGTVIAQDPQANAEGVASPAVNLLVAADGAEAADDGLAMPDLVGQEFAKAALTLRHAGLELAPMQEQAAPGMKTGTVVAESPEAGYRVDPTMPVTLTVAK